MPRLVFLGTSNAIPDVNHENTFMALAAKEHLVLVDCPINPLRRLKQAGMDLRDVTDLALTHFHPDHVSGVPSMLMVSWLLGRTRPMDIYGLSSTLERVQKMMDLYDWKAWENFFPITFHETPEPGISQICEDPEVRIFAGRVRHMIPAMGLRFESASKVVAYSCDTSPCEEVVELARQADILVHEASGAAFGHSSAAQAGEIASRANAWALYLIHYPTGEDFDPPGLIEQARQTFKGPVSLAEDFMEITL